MTKGGTGVEPAGLLHARPQFSQRAKLGDGQELVGIGAETEIDHGAGGIERSAACLECPQIGDGDGQHVSQFLRLRAAGIVDQAAVGACKWAAEALPAEIGNRGIEHRRQPAPGQTAAAMRSRGPDRIEAETDGRGAGRNTAALDQCGEPGRGIAAVRTGIELDADAGIEVHVGERTRECLLGGGEPVAVGADRAGEDEREPGRAVFEIVQGLGICRRRFGMVDALDDRPRHAGCAPRHRLRVRHPAVERLDGEPVIGLGDEPLVERRALEHAFDQLAPLLAGGRGKLGRQR